MLCGHSENSRGSLASSQTNEQAAGLTGGAPVSDEALVSD